MSRNALPFMHRFQAVTSAVFFPQKTVQKNPSLKTAKTAKTVSGSTVNFQIRTNCFIL